MASKCARLLLALAIVWCLGGPQAAQAEGERIGWVDAQKVLDETQAGKDIQTRLEAFRDSRQSVIDMDEQELKTLEERLAQQLPLLSEDAKREKQIEFQRKLEGYQTRVMELTRELQEKKTELLEEFSDVLEAALKAVAERDGYAFVFEYGKESSLLYGTPAHDLTAEIIAQIDGAKP